MVNQEEKALKREIITGLVFSGIVGIFINSLFLFGMMKNNDSMQWSAAVLGLPVAYYLYAKLMPKIKRLDDFDEAKDNG